MKSLFEKGELFYKGAEAEVWKGKYLDLPAVMKHRIPKKYRIQELDDKIRKDRTKKEMSIILLAKDAVNVPHIYEVDTVDYHLIMEFIDGKPLKEVFRDEKNIRLAKEVGRAVRNLHKKNLIHGDLTTSNIIFHDKNIYFVDFGLAELSTRLEDKAVDVVAFKKMLKSTHFKYFDDIWKYFQEGYADKNVLNHVIKVEKRARYV
jgi:Kae1-associated kinase Bud32